MRKELLFSTLLSFTLKMSIQFYEKLTAVFIETNYCSIDFCYLPKNI